MPGDYNQVECCEASISGQQVGPGDMCQWRYTDLQGDQIGGDTRVSRAVNKPSRSFTVAKVCPLEGLLLAESTLLALSNLRIY